ncbi:MAG TPA: nuclear transport factor 2 family protein [Candidatus Paceibacterota bacterium]|nr:nuclear transport factor 2 family protein [Candidatus Paceibacterota bacterium]
MNDTQAIQTLIEEWSKAVRDGNIEGILAHHSNDFVMFDVPPPFKSVGLEEYKKTWDTFFTWSPEPRVFNFTDMHIEAGNEVAFVFATGHCAGKNKEGVIEPLDFRLTMGLRKINGAWTIVHEHHSIPAE